MQSKCPNLTATEIHIMQYNFIYYIYTYSHNMYIYGGGHTTPLVALPFGSDRSSMNMVLVPVVSSTPG